MRSLSQSIRSALLKSLCAFMLSLTLALSPAFALPKSPFLGLDDASAPKMRLLQPSDVNSPFASFDALPMQTSMLASPSNIGLYHLQNVGLFHGIDEVGIILFWIAITTIVVGPFCAIIGQAKGNHGLRNFGNIISYPWLLVPPGFMFNDGMGVPDSDSRARRIYFTVMGSINAASLLTATIGEIAGKHQIHTCEMTIQ